MLKNLFIWTFASSDIFLILTDEGPKHAALLGFLSMPLLSVYIQRNINPFHSDDFSIQVDTKSMSIVRSKKLQVYISNCDVFMSFKVFFFILANSVDPDEMPHNVVFHLGRAQARALRMIGRSLVAFRERFKSKFWVSLYKLCI